VNRLECINIVNKLIDFKLITRVQGDKMMEKRDKLYNGGKR